MALNKTALSRMSVEQLEGKLSEAKARFAEASTNLSAARQSQILKTRTIRGKASQRKKELISQILKIEKQTGKVSAQIRQIQIASNIKFSQKKAAASRKVSLRRKELRDFGSYRTSMTNYEKVLAWCDDMNVDEETLDKLLEVYEISDLAAMSGDEFYDEVNSVVITSQQEEEVEESFPDLDTIMF